MHNIVRVEHNQNRDKLVNYANITIDYSNEIRSIAQMIDFESLKT